MSRQHATPLLLTDAGAIPLAALPLGAGPDQISEAALQDLLHTHPELLPIAEIDPLFANPVPICTELATTAGYIDNLLVTASGLPVLVECKLWRNPQARREVVGQILDYAKELSRWSSADLQREVRSILKRYDDPVLELVRGAGHEVEEIAFNDALTHNLRRGRFLLLIVGDGIREGVEAIAEYLQAHAGLHFTLGLVEMPIFVLPDGSRVVAPRVLARTMLIERTVIRVPEGIAVEDTMVPPTASADISPYDESQLLFWQEFLTGFRLDDPEQELPKLGTTLYLQIAKPSWTVWITLSRNVRTEKLRLYLSYTRGTPGEQVVQRLLADWEALREPLGGSAFIREEGGRQLLQDEHHPAADSTARAEAILWLRKRANRFVSVLRPAVRTLIADLTND